MKLKIRLPHIRKRKSEPESNVDRLRLKRSQNRIRLVIIATTAVIVIIVAVVIIIAGRRLASDQQVTPGVNNEALASSAFEPNEISNIVDESRKILTESNNQPDKAIDYYQNLIKSKLTSGEIFKAFQVLWVGHDELVNNGLEEDAIRLFSDIDISKFDVFQQYSIYDALATMSDHVGNKESKTKYSDLATKAKAEVESILKNTQQ